MDIKDIIEIEKETEELLGHLSIESLEDHYYNLVEDILILEERGESCEITMFVKDAIAKMIYDRNDARDRDKGCDDVGSCGIST